MERLAAKEARNKAMEEEEARKIPYEVSVPVNPMAAALIRQRICFLTGFYAQDSDEAGTGTDVPYPL